MFLFFVDGNNVFVIVCFT